MIVGSSTLLRDLGRIRPKKNLELPLLNVFEAMDAPLLCFNEIGNKIILDKENM